MRLPSTSWGHSKGMSTVRRELEWQDTFSVSGRCWCSPVSSARPHANPAAGVTVAPIFPGKSLRLREGMVCPSICSSIHPSNTQHETPWRLHAAGLSPAGREERAREASPPCRSPSHLTPNFHAKLAGESAVVGLSGIDLSWGDLQTCCQPVPDRPGAPWPPHTLREREQRPICSLSRPHPLGPSS